MSTDQRRPKGDREDGIVFADDVQLDVREWCADADVAPSQIHRREAEAAEPL